jgi:hypothetical protein
MLCLRYGPILEIGRVDVVTLDYPTVPHFAHDVQSAVGRARIGNQDFVGHAANRLDARPNVKSFVLTGNQGSQLGRHGGLSYGENGSGFPNPIKVFGIGKCGTFGKAAETEKLACFPPQLYKAACYQ